MSTYSFEDTALYRLKVRLQFTGWLQYVMNLSVALAFLLVAILGRWIDVLPALFYWLPLGIGALLLLNFIFDVTTLKLGIRPSERIPRRRDELDAFDLMRARRSCRSFQDRMLTPEHRSEIMEQVRVQSDPSGLIGRKPIRFEYVEAPLTVWPTVGAREFLVAIAPHQYDRLAIIDVGRALQKVVLHASRMGLGTCWIGPGASHESVQRHLGDRFDPTRDHIICVCALGYASRLIPLAVRFMSAAMGSRLPLSSLFFRDPQMQEAMDVEEAPFQRFGRCFEACQWSPSSFNAQPTRAVALVERADGEAQLARLDFYASTTSRYYAPVALGIWCANWETGCAALGISGRLAVLTPEERGLPDPGEAAAPPRYDVSWIA